MFGTNTSNILGRSCHRFLGYIPRADHPASEQPQAHTRAWGSFCGELLRRWCKSDARCRRSFTTDQSECSELRIRLTTEWQLVPRNASSATFSEIVAGYERPLPRLRSLLCLAQRSFPLLSGIVLSPLLCKDGVSNFEGAMSCATIADGIAGAI
jgi:hypothetical protein